MEREKHLARLAGFTCAVPVNLDALVVREEVRDMCAADRCQSFGKNWACPPACGTTQLCRGRLSSFTGGILVQTTGALEDDFDWQAIGACYAGHKKAFDTLARQLRMLHPDCLPLTAGACTLCRKCTCPDRPCRFPDRRYSSMEAYGLLVSDVCVRSGVKYNYGPKTITYTSCILFA